MEENDNDDLTRQLAALPRERLPSAAVWQRIAAQLEQAPPAPRIGATPLPVPAQLPRPRRAVRRWPWLAGAAAAVLAFVGTFALWQPGRPATVAMTDTPLQRQANVITHEYRQAIATIPAETVPAELRPALDELDASAGSIRTAIDQSPHAGFLLGQLRRTYALRLELTRQGLAATGLST
ncbi:MAG: hypothetical protein ACN6RG_02885 [Stenotrophomonas sp.]|nr:hypothetical protein [Stenotrophomonas sp. STM01]MBD9534844.1 hypothetical protein [Stenotrophomonas sp. STM01]